MDDKVLLNINDPDGKQRTIEVLNYITLKSTGKKYLIYYYIDEVADLDEDGDVEVCYSRVEEHSNGIIDLCEVTDEESDELIEIIHQLITEGEDD